MKLVSQHLQNILSNLNMPTAIIKIRDGNNKIVEPNFVGFSVKPDYIILEFDKDD